MPIVETNRKMGSTVIMRNRNGRAFKSLLPMTRNRNGKVFKTLLPMAATKTRRRTKYEMSPSLPVSAYGKL